ncbi:ABC transporter permease [Acrocarpospora macrocephala]|uniref:Peptide ABC transporter permease n=1 Tax=Acrocarpospora macrocephala TaxID=150177 RepID=A0A5M3WFU2_9ACTN|nr:ABC transporter permease [Acrocarpospora macrocephala]GES07140.1 peptide ABC transporter permease [Acrocarpospora macrocephala]
MTRYLRRRVFHALIVLWAAYTLAFAVLYLLPGDPVQAMLSSGDGPSVATAAQADELRARLGLDRPLYAQYLDMVWDAVRGDLGTSYRTGESVLGAVARSLGPTFQLTACALVLAVIAGVSIGLLSTYVKSRALRSILQSIPAIGVSVPTFWSGLMLIQVVSFRWKLLPAIGAEGASGLLMPAVALAIPTAATLAQLLSQRMADTLNETFVTTARSKGASRARIHLRHAFRNASLPAVTVLGMLVGQLLSGSVVVETVFSRPGVGRLTIQSVEAHDLPVVQALVILGALVYVAANLAVDVLYPKLDPRVDLSAGASTVRSSA